MGLFKKSSGMTLLELIVALGVVSLMAVIATPALGKWIDSSRSKSARQELQAFLSHARAHALENSQTVAVCHLDELGVCGRSLEFPITQFFDLDRDGVLDAEESILKVIDVDIPEGTSLTWNRTQHLQFWPGGGTGAVNGSLSYCSRRNNENDFRLVIARTGRTRLELRDPQCD